LCNADFIDVPLEADSTALNGSLSRVIHLKTYSKHTNTGGLFTNKACVEIIHFHHGFMDKLHESKIFK